MLTVFDEYMPHSAFCRGTTSERYRQNDIVMTYNFIVLSNLIRLQLKIFLVFICTEVEEGLQHPPAEVDEEGLQQDINA